jgi:transposase
MGVYSKYVGMDVHKETIAVSVADGIGGEPRYLGEIRNRPEAVAKLVRQLKKEGVRLLFGYEAGPCGYELYRQLRSLGQDCQVVAPSLTPRKVGDRIKTDRRDSLTLARLLRAGELTAICIPDPSQEALRDLTRAREDLKRMQKQARQRLLSFLLRHGKRFSGKSHWTQAHFRWLETVKFEHPVQQIVFQEYVDLVQALTKRVALLDDQIVEHAAHSAFTPMITAYSALRGIDRLAATTLAAEIGDPRRFPSAPQMWSYLGLTPSEHSSGPSRSRGPITKTGNGHVRRLLVEAAWSYRHPARKTAILQRRAEKATEAVQKLAWAAQIRLCGRYRYLTGRGKVVNKVCTAVARELVGFIWAIGQTLPALQPST